MENTLNSQKKRRENVIIVYRKYIYCSDVYNLAQKLDNSVQIVKIKGHAPRRKVVPGRRVIPGRAFTRQVG